MEGAFRWLGIVGGAAMPLFNIPLMIRILKRRSADDISLTWLWGVWGCIVLMVPSTVFSTDIVLKAFGYSNVIFFSMVVAAVVWVRLRGHRPLP